jgi:hypothetical protein
MTLSGPPPACAGVAADDPFSQRIRRLPQRRGRGGLVAVDRMVVLIARVSASLTKKALAPGRPPGLDSRCRSVKVSSAAADIRRRSAAAGCIRWRIGLGTGGREAALLVVKAGAPVRAGGSARLAP